MKSRRDLRNEIAIVVMKIAQAERMGGGFRLYFESAPDEILRLFDEDLRHILAGAESAMAEIPTHERDWESHGFVRRLISRLKERLIP